MHSPKGQRRRDVVFAAGTGRNRSDRLPFIWRDCWLEEAANAENSEFAKVRRTRRANRYREKLSSLRYEFDFQARPLYLSHLTRVRLRAWPFTGSA